MILYRKFIVSGHILYSEIKDILIDTDSIKFTIDRPNVDFKIRTMKGNRFTNQLSDLDKCEILIPGLEAVVIK